MGDERPNIRWLRRGLVAAIVTAAIVLVWLGGGDLATWVRYEREEVRQIMNGERVVGWRYVPRGGPSVDYKRLQLWSERTGFLVYDAGSDDGETIQATRWRPDGTLVEQTIFQPMVRAEAKVEPPWWWGQADQAEPTSPWGPAQETGAESGSREQSTDR